MVKINPLVSLLAALVPMVIGFIWYNPKVFGKAWMEACGLNEEKIKGANMFLIFGLSSLFSVILAFSMNAMVIHQFAINSMILGEPSLADQNSEASVVVRNFVDKFGATYRTFKHGALHGFLSGFVLSLALIGTNALFERKGFKYIAINAGYWIISMTIMGGIICQFT